MGNKAKVGDIVIVRGTTKGIILKIDDHELEDDILWAQIMWHDGRITWEDMLCSLEDRIFEILTSNSCKQHC